MLTHITTAKYGDQVVMVAPQGNYVQLPTAGHGVRYFPKENSTETPRFNDMRPNPGVQKKNETPKMDNNYQNGYDSSRSIMIDRTNLPNVDKWFTPPIDRRLKPH